MQGVLFYTGRQPKRKTGFLLRDYQLEDADEISRLWESGHNRVLCVHATGLGKSVMAAEMANRKPSGTRALVIVDSSSLAIDLFQTIKKHTGQNPGLLTGSHKQDLGAEILVATKQCVCAGEKYLEIDFSEFSTVIVDECEAALADEYLLMLTRIMDYNPRMRLMGMTATPLPASRRKITDLFGYAAKAPGLLYRDLQWGYLQGWLVKPMQGVLLCSMAFGSLKVKRSGGEADYTDKDVARIMLDQSEHQWIELAGGIYHIAKNKRAIVIVPNSTLISDKLADYIEGQAREHGRRNVAYSIHANMHQDEAWTRMRRFKADEFSIAVSCKKFEKGFDYDKVDMVVMARRTKSLRLYTQAAGRGTRPLKGIRQALSEEQDPKERMNIIARSDKPSCVIVDCVGVDDEAKNIIGVIDILGRGVRADIKERVRRLMLDKARESMARGEYVQPRPYDVGDLAREAISDERLEKQREADEKRKEEERQRKERERIRKAAEERKRALRASVYATVDTMFRVYDCGQQTLGEWCGKKDYRPRRGTSSPSQVRLLIAMGVHGFTAMAYSRQQAGAVISSYKKKGLSPDWYIAKDWERRYGSIT